MSYNKKVRVLLLFFYSVISISLAAQTSINDLHQLDEVVVAARPYQVVIPSQKLSGKQLEGLTSHSVADALRYFAGVQIKDYGGMGGLKTVNVRNMGSTHVGVFYNGVSVGNAQNGTVDLGKFSLDGIEEVSLYNGQKSDIFQSAKDYSSASAIYIRSKRPQFVGNKRTNVILRYKAGSIQTENPSLRLEQKLNSKFNLSISTEYLHSPGEYKFRYKRYNANGSLAHDTTAYRQNSDIRSFRAESSLFGVFDNGAIWETNIYYYNSDRGLPGAIVKNKFHNGERQKDESFFIQSSFTKDVSDKYRVQFKAKYAYDYMQYQSMDTVRLSDGTAAYRSLLYNNKYYQQQVYATFINRYSFFHNWDVALSVDFDYNRLNASFNTSAGAGDTNTYGLPFSFPQRYSALSSLATSVDLGRFKAQASLVGTFVHETVKNNVKAPDKSVFTPAFFVGYKPFSEYDLNLRFFYKRIFRLPTFNDLYYKQIGYSLLKPEYTNQFNFGLSYEKSLNRKYINAVSFQADVYYMNIKDKIVAAPTGSFFQWMMMNMGKVEGYGADLSGAISSQVDKVNIGLTLKYSYSLARDFTKVDGFKKTSYGDQIPYSPRHSGSLILNSTYKSWMLNYSFVYVGKRYNGSVNNIPVNELQPWYTHDMSLQKSFNIGRLSLEGTVEVNNLLNQYYDVVLNYPMPGRNFKFIISCKF